MTPSNEYTNYLNARNDYDDAVEDFEKHANWFSLLPTQTNRLNLDAQSQRLTNAYYEVELRLSEFNAVITHK